VNIQEIITVARAAGATGIWLLSECAPFVSYDAPADLSEEDQEERSAFVGLSEFEAIMQAEGAVEQRGLDLRDLGRVLIIHLPDLEDAAPAGLTTLQSEAGYCRICGCSETNPCEGEDGPCSWVEADLCSRCDRKSEAPHD
jgi:hypothetical protein